MADDFRAFATAGAALADLHLNWPLDGNPEHRTELGYFWDKKPAAFPDLIRDEAFKVNKLSWQSLTGIEGKFIKYGQHLSIGPIPNEVFDYTIGNRTPLDWIIDRYQVKRDKASGITNDPHDWIAEQARPDALVELIKRVTFLSIETARIVKNLPPAIGEKK